jgi:hypothetical protein
MNKIRFVLAVILVAMHIAPGRIQAVPLPKEKFKEISGTVVEGTWISGVDSIRFARLGDTESWPKEIGTPDCWYLVLKDVQGLTNDELANMSVQFVINLANFPFAGISERIQRRLKAEKLLFVCFRGGFDKRIRLGAKVSLLDVVYQADDWGGSMSYSKLEIHEGKGSDQNTNREAEKQLPVSPRPVPSDRPAIGKPAPTMGPSPAPRRK